MVLLGLEFFGDMFDFSGWKKQELPKPEAVALSLAETTSAAPTVPKVGEVSLLDANSAAIRSK